MNIMFVAMDAGPSQALGIIQREVLRRGHPIATELGMGTPFHDGTVELVEKDAASCIGGKILIGLSSSKERSREELAAAETARSMGIPYGFMCCNYGEFRRPWFRDVIRDSSFLFTVCESDAQAAKEFAPKATIVGSGNPVWASFFEWPMSRDEVRSRLGIAPDEKLILCSGTKVVDINLAQWESVAHAAKRLRNLKLRVLLSRHPGEQNPPNDRYSEFVLNPAIQFLSGLNTSQALCGADVLISGHSLTGIESACKRIPMIDFVSDAEEVEWRRLSGSNDWPPAEQGASILARDASYLAATMRELLNTESPMAIIMRAAQEQSFSLEAVQGATKKIVDTLLDT